MKKHVTPGESLVLASEKYDMSFEKAVVGFSGGADSVTLLDCMYKKYGGRVAALHVNHMLRGADADADENFCREFCKVRGIEFLCKKVDVMAASGGVAIEETARNMRYAALREAAASVGADAIALAHTLDDNAETALFNMARGTGISGLGIPPVRYTDGIKIIRPLIYCSKDDILEYIEKNGLSFVTDKSNFETKYSRNGVRINVMPRIKEINSAASQNMMLLSERARTDEDFIDGFAKEYFGRDDKYELENLRELHIAVLSRVIMKMAAEVSETALSSQNIDDVIALIESGKSGNKLMLAGNITALVADGKLTFSCGDFREREPRRDFSFEFSGDDIISGEFGFSVSLKKSGGEREFCAELPEKFTVRCRKTDDKIFICKMNKSVKKLTTSVPFDARTRRPVFEYGGKVIWYPGYPAATLPDDVKKIKIYYKEISF